VTELKTIHFIGIGGVGMSGIALVAKARGITVSGSDMKESRATRKLAEAGIEVFIGHDAANVPQDCDVVVVSSAIPEKNPELVEAHRRGISVWHRSQMLAELGKGRKTLACAGTHGKTTSSSMLATTIDRMGLDPSFLIGGTVDGYDTNAKNGTGEYYIVEADESDGSFVHLSPYVALITNVEADHLDHYGTLDAIYDAFGDFMGLVPDEGAVVVCADNPRLVELARSTGKRTIPYGEKGTPGAEAVFTVKGRDGLGYAFTVEFPDGQSADVSIRKNPGRHNVLNATGVLSVVWACGLDIQKGAEALSTFSGVRRRFDLVGEEDGVTVVDDYAHHPTEIKATIKAASQLDFKHVHVLFQPHRYTRTQSLAQMFGDAFELADSITVMDVYPAGEAPIPGVSGKTVVRSLLEHDARQQVAWMPHRQEIVPYLISKLSKGDLLITMGAGDVTTMGPLVCQALAKKA
jgi:UDP-N-acetylmuramate--alanine ligase